MPLFHYKQLAIGLLVAAAFGAPIQAADVKDLLDLDRLAKHLKADAAQKAQLADDVDKLKKLVADYQYEHAKRTCEAVLWQGHIPQAQDLRARRKAVRDSVDAVVAALKTENGLDEKQKERIDKILKGDDNILDHPISDHPFYHVRNSPLFSEFAGKTSAYQLTLPGQPAPDFDWNYAQLLQTWTVRGYIPTVRPIDDLQQTPSIAEHPDLQTRVLAPSDQARLVRSPLLVAATLHVPDLGRREFDLLQTYYNPDSTDVTTWDAYARQNRYDDAIQVRVKLNTPYNEAYLDLKRWIIYLEDSDGVGYEPREVKERAYYPLEAVRVSVPGREIEVTDVFGQYISPIPGDKERFYLEAPAQVTYVGNEKLLQFFFPGRDFQGNPIVTDNIKYLKLVVQSQETDFGRCELTWELKRSRDKARPPKD